MPEDLEVLRARIQELDEAVIRLLGERFANVRLLGRWKRIEGVPIEDPAREVELSGLYRRAAEREGLDVELVESLFRLVLEHSKAEQLAQAQQARRA